MFSGLLFGRRFKQISSIVYGSREKLIKVLLASLRSTLTLFPSAMGAPLKDLFLKCCFQAHGLIPGVFKFSWAFIPEAAVHAFAVIEGFDVIEDFQPRFGVRFILLLIDHLKF